MRILFFVQVVFYMKVACIFSQTADWGSRMAAPDANYYTIRDDLRAYFESDTTLLTTQGSGYKDFLRWEYFWKDRVYKTGSGPDGNFLYASDALLSFLQGQV